VYEGYTDEQKKEIEQIDNVEVSDIIMYNLRKKGLTYSEIAKLTKFSTEAFKKTEIHPTTVMRHIDRLREMKGEVVLSRMMLKRLYEEEMRTPEEIADMAGAGRMTVYRRLHEYKMLKPRDRDNMGRFLPVTKDIY